VPDPEEEIFEACLARPIEERARYLDRVCAGDAALRHRVEELLRSHSLAESFLEEAPVSVGAGHTVKLDVPLAEKVGDHIGRYKLLQQIGEGGCGVVYMAEQQEPVKRRVALKVIKLGMDTKSVIARFEAERQALAMMDHPNIAKVLDAGATDKGRPYFVMELVRGIKITDYCDKNNLSTRERLLLFVQVCQSIQHAHQKGIIHRDIKPSNILVTLRDGVPVPKVIDFGIAKATTDQRLTDKTLFTAFEQFIGTPTYMSPEQAEMSELGIDTRSDIYSLGVLLYELLTGQTPFEASRLVEVGLDEIRRVIRDEEPPRPSARLSTLAAAEQTKVASHRHSVPPKLLGLIRGDLDWIVMKTLEKDRSRRYETAERLAVDIERHLGNNPVVARPPSELYRLQKLIRRNKTAFEVAGVVAFVAMIALFIGMRISRAPAMTNRADSIPQIKPVPTNAFEPGAAPNKPGGLTAPIATVPTNIVEPTLAHAGLAAGDVSGVVLAEDTGQPIAHALVQVASPSLDMRDVRGVKRDYIYEGQTDREGRFNIQAPHNGTISVDALAPGYESAGGGLMWLKNRDLYGLPFGPGQKQNLTIKLRPALCVAGVVVDEAGRTCSAVRVEATLRAPFAYGYVDITLTDTNGRFEIFDFKLKPGWRDGSKGQLSFTDPAMLRTVITDVYQLSDSERRTLRVTLRRGHDVKGRVTSATGDPVTALEVEAIPSEDDTEVKSSLTDSNGQFVIQGLPDGELTMRAHSLAMKQKVAAKARLAGADITINLRLEPVVLKNPPRTVSLFGMKLADANAELQSVYDQDEPTGVIVLDAGTNCARLGVGGLAEGCRFWTVGLGKINNVREMATVMSQLIDTTSMLEGHLTTVRVAYMNRGSYYNDTAYLKLTWDDVNELKKLVAAHP